MSRYKPGADKRALGSALGHVLGFLQDEKARRGILILHCGGDDGDPVDYTVAIAELEQSKIPVYAMSVGSDADTALLRKLSRKSGGVFFKAKTVEELPEALDEFAEKDSRRFEKNE